MALVSPSHLQVPPGNEAFALSVAGLEEFLCLPQHGPLAGLPLLSLLPLLVVQGTQGGRVPLKPLARTLGTGDHPPVWGSHGLC